MKTTISRQTASQLDAPATVQRQSRTVASRLQSLADQGPQASQLQSLQARADDYIQRKVRATQMFQSGEDEELLQGRFATAQREADEEEELLQGRFAAQLASPEEEELLQGRFMAVQREADDEEETLQGRFERVTGNREAVHRKVDPTTEVGGMPINDDPGLEHEADVMGAKAAQFVPSTGGTGEVSQQEKKPNDTGLPDNLKSGIENLSGMSMDGVKVHYNSEKPAQLNALAYAQGTDIHVGPGQEQHLPHEAWHVVQQGR